MPRSSSRQDEPNSLLWLATRPGKMELSCPLGITRCFPHENGVRCTNIIDQACLLKMNECCLSPVSTRGLRKKGMGCSGRSDYAN